LEQMLKLTRKQTVVKLEEIKSLCSSAPIITDVSTEQEIKRLETILDQICRISDEIKNSI
jgi:hypothetical protein